MESGTGTISGVISDGGHGYGVTKTVNTGTIALSGTNTFSGGMTISGGILTISGAGDLGDLGNGSGGSYAGAITNNSAFLYASSAAQTLSGVISGTGVLVQSGPGVLTLSGTNTYTGGTLITNGSTLIIDDNHGAGDLGDLGNGSGGSYAGAITNYGYIHLRQFGGANFVGSYFRDRHAHPKRFRQAHLKRSQFLYGRHRDLQRRHVDPGQWRLDQHHALHQHRRGSNL